MKQKPSCRRCGEPHWPFIRCDEVTDENRRESDKAAVHAAAQVHAPVSRAQTARPPSFVGRNFVEQAPGVYRRIRRG